MKSRYLFVLCFLVGALVSCALRVAHPRDAYCNSVFGTHVHFKKDRHVIGVQSEEEFPYSPGFMMRNDSVIRAHLILCDRQCVLIETN